MKNLFNPLIRGLKKKSDFQSEAKPTELKVHNGLIS